MNFEEFSSLEDLSNSASKPQRYQVSKSQKEKFAEFIQLHLSMAEGKATLESSPGWVQVTKILNAMSNQKARSCDDWRKTWERYVKRARAEFTESKKVPENGAPKYVISPFSIKVLHLLACLEKYQAERHPPTQPPATFTQASAHQEISSSRAVGSLGRLAQFLQPDFTKHSSLKDQLPHTMSAKSDMQALLQSPDPLFPGADGQNLEIHCTNQSSEVTNSALACPGYLQAPSLSVSDINKKNRLLRMRNSDLNKDSRPRTMYPSAYAPIVNQIPNYSITSAEYSSASIVPPVSGKERMNLSTPSLALPETPESLQSIIASAMSVLRENSRIIHEELQGTVSDLHTEASALADEMPAVISKLAKSVESLEQRVELIPKTLEDNVGPLVQSFLSSIRVVNFPSNDAN